MNSQQKTNFRLWVFFSLFLLLFLRVLALFAIPPHPDEMVQLYMTDDIAHLRNFPAYFYGQEFMGPFESYFLAPFVRVFGSGYVTARFWNGLFYLSFLVLYVGMVKRLFERELSVYLFFLLSVVPFPVLFFTTIVGYVEILPLTMLSLALLLRVSQDARSGGGNAAALGFVSGLAFWCNPIFVIWMVPIGISLVWLIPSSWKRKIPPAFAAGFVAGLFPAWVHGWHTGVPMFVHTAGTRFTPWSDLPRLGYLFFARMKYFLSTSFFEKSSLLRRLIPYPALLVLSAFLISFAALFVSFLRNFTRQSVQEKIFHLFILLPPFALAGLYISRDLTTDEGIRYFLPLTVSYPFAIAWRVRGFRSPFWKRAALISLGGIFLGASLASLTAQNRQRQNFVQIYRFLEQNKLRYGVGDLNAAYAMNAFSRNQIQVTPALYEMRCRPLWNTVQEKGAQFFIFEQVDHRFRKKLESDPRLKKISLGGRDIYYGSSGILQEIVETKEPL